MCCGSSPPAGVELGEMEPIEVDDPKSSRPGFPRNAHHQLRPHDPRAQKPQNRSSALPRACLSFVPVVYASPGRVPTPIGVINLTDRTGEDAFTRRRRKLVAAIANQIGAAIENARTRRARSGQQRLRRELSSRTTCSSAAAVARRRGVEGRRGGALPSGRVGGGIHNLLSLPTAERIGMRSATCQPRIGGRAHQALAMAASGIHAETAESA